MAALDALVAGQGPLHRLLRHACVESRRGADAWREFRGWAPLIALQIEYSLLERTVEGELMPMAQALGLGVTPWSPLRSGVLSGKYSRSNMKAESAGRADWVARNANEHTFQVLDVLSDVARKRDTTPARAAIAWVLSRPGVTSPILGVRTESQLDDNLAAVDLKLAPEDIAALDAVSRPKLNFPTKFLDGAVPASYPAMMVNGRDFELHSRAEQMEAR